MVTTVENYGRFAAWVARGADLPPALFADMGSVQIDLGPRIGWGIGWTLVDIGDRTVLYHGGGEEGTRTFVTVSPETGDGLVVFTNSSLGDQAVYNVVAEALPWGPALLNGLALMEMYTLESYWESIDLASELDLHLNDIHHNPNKLPVILLSAKHLLVTGSGLDPAEKAQATSSIQSMIDAVVQDQFDATGTQELAGLIATPNEQGTHWFLRTDVTDAELQEFLRRGLEPLEEGP